MRMLGLRMKRNLSMKEVIIEDPDYRKDRQQLAHINDEIVAYNQEHKLLSWPNPIKVFFRPGDDHDIQGINEELEAVIENLSYTRDPIIMGELNHIPIIATRPHATLRTQMAQRHNGPGAAPGAVLLLPHAALPL